ncbi:MAG: PQQ-binding-like beta-propeller repeat protein [Acidobacteria bacterium]|nr:PQQ-binding-like beta-propeller repeat protein [Acidobacteriota bacterium]
MRATLFFGGVLLFATGVQTVSNQSSANWPQFRGPNASGLATGETAPTEFGPNKAVAWKRALPAGHSSPAIWDNRIFLTGFDKASRKLEVLCLSTKDGEILWRHVVPATQIETVHEVSNPATATPAVDGENVYAYFASFGAIALDHAGKERWSAPLPILKTAFGSGTSPVVHGDLLVLNRDAVENGSLLALDRRTGKTVWKTDYPVPQGRRAESYSTPVVWKGQIVLHRLGVVEGYDPKDGRRQWWVNASTSGTSTVVGGSDAIYAATWSAVGEADQFPTPPDFATLAKDHDKDGNGQISEAELPPTLYVFSRPDMTGVPGASMPMSRMFGNMDRNKDGLLNETEWQQAVAFLRTIIKEHGVVAIRPDGEGDLTSKVLWTEKLAVPEVPSPLLQDNRLYLVRNGGILSCLDAASGKVVYRTRVGAPGPYYASPVAANGKIYLASGEGTVSVLVPGDEFKVAARNDLGEPIYATPAIAAGTLYVRTVDHLYAFR